MASTITYDEVLRNQVQDLTRKLAECYRLAGADASDYDDWLQASMAVDEVHRLRDERDVLQAENASLGQMLKESRGLFAKVKERIERLEQMLCRQQQDHRQPVMKPYYEHGGITIYHGDCREILPTLPRVSLVLTDPPYALGSTRNEWNATAAVGIGLHEAAKLVAKGGALLAFTTSSGRGIEYTLGAVGKTLPFNRLLVWRKALSTSKAAGPWQWDLVSILAFGRATFGLTDRSSLIESAEPRKGREHPSQVPADVAEWLFRPFFHSSGIVLDPFLRSGRLLVPAVNAGRTVVGIEIEERYCELAAKRLSQEVRSLEHIA